VVVEGTNNNNEQRINAVIRREMRNENQGERGQEATSNMSKMTLKQAMKGQKGRATGKQHTSYCAHCE
jgi:hypothetical protein